MSTSFSPGSLQAHCFLCLEYSSPLHYVSLKGREQSGATFCFKLLGPVSASCQSRMVQMSNQACPPFIAHSLHLEPLTLTVGNGNVSTPNTASSFPRFLCLCSRIREMGPGHHSLGVTRRWLPASDTGDGKSHRQGLLFVGFGWATAPGTHPCK